MLPPAAPATPAANQVGNGEAARQLPSGGASSPVRDAELLEEFEELERGSD
jgi:hypothetical protein